MKKQKINKKAIIPEDKKVLFGKFFVFSIFLFIFLVMYPFFIMKYVSIASNIGIFIVLPVMYVFMIADVIRKRDVYRSNLFPISIIIFVVTYVFTLIKFIGFA